MNDFPDGKIEGVYLLYWDDQPFFKIGHAVDAVHRYKTLSKNWGSIDPNKSLMLPFDHHKHTFEKTAHKMFEQYRIEPDERHDGHTEMFDKICYDEAVKFFFKYYSEFFNQRLYTFIELGTAIHNNDYLEQRWAESAAHEKENHEKKIKKLKFQEQNIRSSIASFAKEYKKRAGLKQTVDELKEERYEVETEIHKYKKLFAACEKTRRVMKPVEYPKGISFYPIRSWDRKNKLYVELGFPKHMEKEEFTHMINKIKQYRGVYEPTEKYWIMLYENFRQCYFDFHGDMAPDPYL